jgi:hypothetical protein
MSVERDRLQQDGAAWRRWGPYLSERAWGTVREDYSATGEAWDFLPHDHARSKAYRWNEDGLGGICDDQQHLCFALALWNGRDPILKERLFGLTGSEGNHGEDCKELYYFLDSTPTHSYMRMLYKYPQRAYPYEELLRVNRQRTRMDPEYELIDTEACADDRYFDVFIEYAKAAPDDVLVRISAVNRGPDAAPLHLLPTLWFRNTWSWGRQRERPRLRAENGKQSAWRAIRAEKADLGSYVLACEGADTLLFTENETNNRRLYEAANATTCVKDAFHEYLIYGRQDAVKASAEGTKAAALYARTLGPGETATLRLRLTARGIAAPFKGFDDVFAQRQREADEFYDEIQPAGLTEDLRRVQRQAFAGMLWSKQFYHYHIHQWLEGDPTLPPPPEGRKHGRNAAWTHLSCSDVISMPDSWEYPWFANWDLAFHCLPLALVDPEFAKNQLLLLLQDRYQHPNGEIPAYEWAFGDANPPVMAFAALRVNLLAKRQTGKDDYQFLDRAFHKLLLDFTWWVNRKDAEGNNIFEGGFLGLDNIGVFDRSAPLPTGGHLEQSDGTSWMAIYCTSMMGIAAMLATVDPIYEELVAKFAEHFLYIAGAMNNIGGDGTNLWNEEDQFFYDILRLPDGSRRPLTVRTLVGLAPLFAAGTVDAYVLQALPEFRERIQGFMAYRPDLAALIPRTFDPGGGGRALLALVGEERQRALLRRMLDPDEFLSDYGIRAVSRHHLEHPYLLEAGGALFTVNYEPAESHTGMFGGNSNWRGPIWMPMNFMLIDALQRFHYYYGDDFTVECPTGSGNRMTLEQVADEISRRLIRIFTRDEQGLRAFNGGQQRLQTDPNFRDYILFYEYFHGDNGAGIGASHQTGWTGLVAVLIDQQARVGREAELATALRMGRTKVAAK